MTNKRVEFDPHFADDARDRGFTRQDGRWLLERGTQSDVETRGGETRFAREGIIRGRTAKIIYLENTERVRLISIMWVLSKGGLARQKKGQGRRKGKIE